MRYKFGDLIMWSAPNKIWKCDGFKNVKGDVGIVLSHNKTDRKDDIYVIRVIWKKDKTYADQMCSEEQIELII